MSLPAIGFPLAGVVKTTSDGPVEWTSAPPAWACVVLAALLVLVVRAIYRRERVRPSLRMRLLLVGLRLLAITAVALALFRPERAIIRTTQERSRLVLLVDTSASMLTKDRLRPEMERALLDALWPEGGDEARPASIDLPRRELVARALVGRDAAVVRALAARFDLDVLAFDQDVRPVASTLAAPDDAGPAGESRAPVSPEDRVARAIREMKEPSGSERTDLAGALRSVAREYVGREDRRLAGVLLFTDGRDTSGGPPPADAIAQLGRLAEELHTTAIALGDPGLAHNLRVDRVRAKDVILVQDQAGFDAELRHTGFTGVAGVRVTLDIHRIRDEADRAIARPEPVAEEPEDQGVRSAVVTLRPEEIPTPVVLRATFKRAGTYDVGVVATLPPALASQDAFAEDNVKHVTIRVKDEKIRVLLADDVLRHESWFLKNILIREGSHPGDPRRVEAQAYIQSFDPEVPQPHGPGVPPLRAFPSTRQEIFSYDVIILGDIDWRRLTKPADERKSREILQLIKEFAAEGGGVAFIAGTDRSPDQFLDTPLQDLLPVDVAVKDRVAGAGDPFGSASPSIPFRIVPTELGATHPILALAHDATDPVAPWAKAEGWEWYWLYRTRGGVKLGAQALARAGVGVLGERERGWFLDDRGDPFVVFATVGYGKGRTFFSAVDDVYRIRRESGDVYYGAFWDETIRWLATYRLLGGNRRFKIDTDKDTYFVGETALVRITALDADYRPLTDKELRGFGVEDPSGKSLVLGRSDAPRLEAEGGYGTYKTAVRLSKSGAWRFSLAPPGTGGEGSADKRVEVLFATEEARDRSPDHGTLEALVRATNPRGKAPSLKRLDELDALAASLEARTTERPLDRHSESIWDSSGLLWIVAALLTAEWVLRKRLRMV